MSNHELKGIAAAPGIVDGVAWLYRARGAASGPPPEVGSVAEETERLEQAREAVSRQLDRLAEEFGSDQRNVAAIFEAQALMLADPGLGECTLELINQGSGAEEAVRRCGERFSFQLQKAPSATIRDRAQDCREVTDRLLGVLLHETAVRAEANLAGRVVVARELPPGEAVWVLRAGAVALVLEHGGTTSHTAIIARALDVPAVVGIHDPLARIPANRGIRVDGDAGTVLLQPTTAIRRSRTARGEDTAEAAPAEAEEVGPGPCHTASGERIHLAANLELPEELGLIARYGAEGIGLYRSEFLLIETDPELPSEEQQIACYRQLLEATEPYDLVVRTYDLGGRKLAREVLATGEEHPSLGLRGIRILDLRRHLFHSQLRAVLRAASEGENHVGRLKILLPMVSTVHEVLGFRRFLTEVADELSLAERPQVGAMIETPAAALISRSLGKVSDFLAIGSNDLVQYTLAAERDNEHVADLYQPFHPAVLHLLQAAVRGADAAGVPISVCGEMAADANGQMLLLGLGVRRLSLHPARIGDARRLLPDLDCHKLKQLAGRCLECASAEEVLDLLARQALPGGADA